MELQKIQVCGFRNLQDAELDFAGDFNFVTGANGAGKTNLLEAIFYVGLASSFRAKEERSLIRTECDYLRVSAEAYGKRAAVYLDRQQKKLTLQGNDVRRLSDFVGWLGMTVLSIDDIWLIRGSPARRRSFLDWVIAKLSPRYCSTLAEYRRILQQRNRALQSARETRDTRSLEVFDEQLMHAGNEIYRERATHIPHLRSHTQTMGSTMGLENLDFQYESTCSDMHMDERVLADVREKELIFGHTIVGPHRDDLVFSINGFPLRNYASEGEERATAISLKLAEAEMLYSRTGERPVLLLDEVTAELDEKRRDMVLRLLKGQVFYASTQLPQFAMGQSHNSAVFAIKRGHIEVSAAN
jgi:DNA replication and repair protein RecF